jgi:hypothetical protein
VTALQHAADRGKTEIEVEGLHNSLREFIAAFARELHRFSSEFPEEIKIHVFDSPSTVISAGNFQLVTGMSP